MKNNKNLTMNILLKFTISFYLLQYTCAGVCYYEGKAYENGQQRTASDGCHSCTCEVASKDQVGNWACTCVCKDGFFHDCNGCSCRNDGFAVCTLRSCERGVCYYEGKAYENGQQRTASDGCNSCTCEVASIFEVGKWACTEKACGCEYKKPCSCVGVVQFSTRNEPTASLQTFSGLSPEDVNTALNYLHVWSMDNFDRICKVAKCDQGQLVSAATNVSTYINNVLSLEQSNKNALSFMRNVINCNANIEIEGNLWAVYDKLCDRDVAIENIKLDLIQKRKMFEGEKERCSNRSWYKAAIEGFKMNW